MAPKICTLLPYVTTVKSRSELYKLKVPFLKQMTFNSLFFADFEDWFSDPFDPLVLSYDAHDEEDLGGLDITRNDNNLISALNPLGTRNVNEIGGGINISYDPEQFSVSAGK